MHVDNVLIISKLDPGQIQVNKYSKQNNINTELYSIYH